MGALCKLVDTILLLLFLLFSVVVFPLFNLHIVLPEIIHADVLGRLNNIWIEGKFQVYLVREKTPFFVGLLWFELVFVWPLSLLNIYGLLTSKPWFNTTCLIFGTYFVTCMVAIFGEMVGSQKASNIMWMMMSTLMGLGVLAMLRGLVSGKAASPTAAKAPPLASKKRA